MDLFRCNPKFILQSNFLSWLCHTLLLFFFLQIQPLCLDKTKIFPFKCVTSKTPSHFTAVSVLHLYLESVPEFIDESVPLLQSSASSSFSGFSSNSHFEFPSVQMFLIGDSDFQSELFSFCFFVSFKSKSEFLIDILCQIVKIRRTLDGMCTYLQKVL